MLCALANKPGQKKPRSGEETNGASLEALRQLAQCKLSRSAVIQKSRVPVILVRFSELQRPLLLPGLHSDPLACDAPRSMKEGL
jgi:hypothetical protein